jgi:hypothetical protein
MKKYFTSKQNQIIDFMKQDYQYLYKTYVMV